MRSEVWIRPDDMFVRHGSGMSGLARLWRRYLDLFVAEVRRPDGSTYIVSIEPTGLGDCWLPVEIRTCETDEVSTTA